MLGKLKPRSRKAGKAAPSAVPKPSVKTKSKGSKSEARKLTGKTVAPALKSGSGSEDEEEDEAVEGAEAEDDNEDEETEDEDDGVDEEGMKRLMKALGEDGLDDIGHMQLDVLEGEDEEDGSEGEDVEGSEQSESDVEAEAEAQKSSNEQGEPGGEEEEDVALEDAESVDEDAVPRQRLITNNKIALERIHDSIKLDPSISWTETLTVTYPETIDVDVNDDLNRELAFYKQALYGATTARALASSHNLPFTRPQDYFAEMVKSDAHMERIRQRLLDESATLKQAEERRKEREGKKYGKQVQIEKLKERERRKKEMEERLKGLKRKNKDVLDDTQAGDDAFDVAVEDAIADRPSKRSKTSDQGNSKSKSKLPRKARDSKFGFGGGKGRRDKQNTRESTEKFDFGAGGGRGGGGGGKGAAKKSGPPKRLGKSRRMATRNR